jgi:hypothetical protein
MEQVAAVRWASVIERQDAKLELIRAKCGRRLISAAVLPPAALDTVLRRIQIGERD